MPTGINVKFIVSWPPKLKSNNNNNKTEWSPIRAVIIRVTLSIYEMIHICTAVVDESNE